MAVLAVLLCLVLLGWGTASAAELNDIGGHWAAAEIEKAVASGYVKGYPDGTFRPDNGVSSAEFVAMLDSAFQVPTGNCDNPADVSDQDWFAQDVQSALAAGFVSGYPDGTFRPWDEVSRQEAACMLANLLNLDGATTLSFSDTGDVAGWASSSVSGLVASGIMTGYPDGSFKPTIVITRAEAVVMINRALALQSLTPVSGQLQVTGDAVNIRSGPNTSAQIVGEVNSGDILQAKAKNGDDWYEVDYQGGPGWVAGQYVQDYQPPSATSSIEASSGAPGTGSQASSSPSGNSPTSTSPTSNSQPTLPQASNSTSSNSIPGSIPVEPSRGDTAAPNLLQVGSNDAGSAVDIQGAQGSVQGANNTGSQTPDNQTAYQKIGTSAMLTPVTGQLQVTGDAVNVHSGPDTSSEIIGQVNDGDILQAEAKNDDDWYEVEYQGGSGWVAGQYVDVSQPSSTSSSTQATGSPLSTPQGSSTASNCAPFCGVDLAAYPGDDVMQAWWDNSPFCYTGFYLGPAPYHPDTSFMDKRQVLVDQGWGLLPIYVGRQADSWSLDQGTEDGDDAANLAASAGFPSHTVIFLDIETSSPLSESFLSYVTDWVSEVESRGYIAGIYCFVDNASQIAGALPDNAQFWVSYYIGNDLPSPIPSPADSGVSFASEWQCVGDTCLTYGGDSLDIDINTSTYTDPSTESVNVKK